MPRADRDHAVLIGLIGYIAAILFVDARFASHLAQYGLAVVTWAVFLATASTVSREDRRNAWLCIAFSTLVEYACTQAWGLYHYRLGNVPMYVPPGHGLVFLFGLLFARQSWVRRHARSLSIGALGVATSWCVLTVLVLPMRGATRDVHGALYWPFFVYYLLTKKNAPVYVATFFITSWIELLGVAWGTWHWASPVPGLGIPSADPPALIAGGYCSFGEVAVALGAWWSAKSPATVTHQTARTAFQSKP